MRSGQKTSAEFMIFAFHVMIGTFILAMIALNFAD